MVRNTMMKKRLLTIILMFVDDCSPMPPVRLTRKTCRMKSESRPLFLSRLINPLDPRTHDRPTDPLPDTNIVRKDLTVLIFHNLHYLLTRGLRRTWEDWTTDSHSTFWQNILQCHHRPFLGNFFTPIHKSSLNRILLRGSNQINQAPLALNVSIVQPKRQEDQQQLQIMKCNILKKTPRGCHCPLDGGCAPTKPLNGRSLGCNRPLSLRLTGKPRWKWQRPSGNSSDSEINTYSYWFWIFIARMSRLPAIQFFCIENNPRPPILKFSKVIFSGRGRHPY